MALDMAKYRQIFLEESTDHLDEIGRALFDLEKEMSNAEAIDSLFRKTIALDGTLSGEHGIGLAKRDYMPLEQSPAVLEWQRRWKRMLDPRHLLNPGKVL